MELSKYTLIIAVLPNYFGGGKTVTDTLVKAIAPHGYRFILITARRYTQNATTEIFDSVIGTDIPLVHYSEATTAQLYNLIKPLKGDNLWLIGDEYANISLLRSALNPGGRIIYQLHSVPFFQARLKDTFSENASVHPWKYIQWYLTKHLREKLLHTYSKRYFKRTHNTLKTVDAYITLCNGYAQELQTLYPDTASKIRAIYNPPSNIKEAGTASKADEIVYVGRLSHEDKRIDKLLRIFARVRESHPTWKLKIIGDGPDRHNLQSLARKLRLENVEFLGYIPNPDISSASIICLTSAIEGWPMSLVEAMQQNVVPIAFNCSTGVAELLAEGRGILIAPNNLDEYTSQLIKLMDSPKLRISISARGEKFIQNMDINRITEQWLSILHTNHYNQ